MGSAHHLIHPLGDGATSAIAMVFQPLINFPRCCILSICGLVFFIGLTGHLHAKENDLAVKESWQVHRDFNHLRPRVIAVLPMDAVSACA